MANENQLDLINRTDLLKKAQTFSFWNGQLHEFAVVNVVDVKAAPTVEAVEVPKGKPGDYVKWTNGISERLFEISSIVICKDGMRYDLGDFCPFVNHPNILEIMSREEAERGMQDG